MTDKEHQEKAALITKGSWEQDQSRQEQWPHRFESQSHHILARKTDQIQIQQKSSGHSWVCAGERQTRKSNQCRSERGQSWEHDLEVRSHVKEGQAMRQKKGRHLCSVYTDPELGQPNSQLREGQWAQGSDSHCFRVESPSLNFQNVHAVTFAVARSVWKEVSWWPPKLSKQDKSPTLCNVEGPIQLSNATFFLHSSCSYWPHQRGLNSQGTFLNIPLCSSRLAGLLWAHCFLPDLRNRLWKKDTVFLNYWRCSRNCSAGLENGEQKIKESANLLRKK